MLDNFDINTVIQILMFLVISIQLYFMQKTFRADHERRKKQATVEYLNKIREQYRTLSNKLIGKFNEDAINLSKIDDGTRIEIKELLSILEHLSTGVNTEVYDYDIIKRMSGSYLVNRYKQLYPYIDNAQKSSRTLYIEFETLCKRIENDKRQFHISNDGNMEYS